MIAGFFSGLQQRMNSMASSFGNSFNKFGTAMSPVFNAALAAATQSAMVALAQQIGNMNNPIASNVLNTITSPVPPTTTPNNPVV